MYHFIEKLQIVNMITSKSLHHNPKVTILLQQFILDEMRQRDMSARAFARFVDVSSATILRAISETPPEPSLTFLVKLAEATSVDICTLVLLAVGNHPAPNIDARVLAARLEALPPDLRELAEIFLSGMLMQKSQKAKKE